jgi:hypothetical protein
MVVDVSKGADTVIKITPRIIALIIIATIGFYSWLFITFFTKAEASEITAQLSAHITEVTLYRVELDIDNIEDKLFDLRERMNEPNGNTVERRKKANEFERRIARLKEQKECIYSGKQNCNLTK